MNFESVAEQKAYPIINTLAITNKLKFEYQKKIGYQRGGYSSRSSWKMANGLMDYDEYDPRDDEDDDWVSTHWESELYRIDFALESPYKKIGIEIDGEEFHKDVRKDDNRDVNLQRYGYIIYHFPANMVLKTPYLFREQINKLIVEELLVKQ